MKARREAWGALDWLGLVLLALWSTFLLVRVINDPGGDWSSLSAAGRLMLGVHDHLHSAPGGFHLYANYPQFQIGPLAVFLSGLLAAVPPRGGIVAVKALIAALGLVSVCAIASGARASMDDGSRETKLWNLSTVLGGLMVITLWNSIVSVEHLDDALVLACGACALYSVATRRPILTAVLVGVAVAAKPWGVLELPILMVGEDRLSLKLGVAAGIITAAWAPFLLLDGGTIGALHYQIANSPDSSLRVLGFRGRTVPPWIRTVQLSACLLATSLAVRWGRWRSVLLVGIGLRIALDAGTFDYYSAGLILGAYAWDVLASRVRMPLLTLLAFVVLYDTQRVSIVSLSSTAFGLSRLLLCTVLLLVGFLAPSATPLARVGLKQDA